MGIPGEDEGYGLIGTEGSVTSEEGLALRPLLVKAACRVVLLMREEMVGEVGV